MYKGFGMICAIARCVPRGRLPINTVSMYPYNVMFVLGVYGHDLHSYWNKGLYRTYTMEQDLMMFK